MNKKDIEAGSPFLWVYSNTFITENQKALEFDTHRFLIDPFNDLHPDQVYLKSAQVGMSVTSILKSFWMAKYMGANIGYVLPSQNIVKDFVSPKVDPLISSNPEIAALVSKDSVTLKQIGDRFVYFRGAFSEREAIAISLDVLVLDELDRMPNMNIINTYDSRLQASDFAFRWRLSNPSVPNYGVHEWYLDSDQRHWFVKCTHCSNDTWMHWEQSEDKNHYVDVQKEIFACGKCGKEITDTARKNGRWVAKYPRRTYRHGYWMSQLIAPWVTAKRIIEQYNESSTEFFYNFVLGLPYQAADLLIDRDSIIKANKPKEPMLRNVVMGTDVGKPHWYWIASPDGFFKCGKTTDWDELERLFNLYKCTAWVIDSMPEFTQVQRLIRKYPNKVFGCTFVNSGMKDVSAIRWMEGDKRGLVYVDRTRAIDRVVTEITNLDMQFLQPKQDLEEFIQHASNMYRTVETDEKGKVVVHWNTKESKPDHLVFALLYCRIALERAFSGVNSGVVETAPLQNNNTHPTIRDGNITVDLDIEQSMERAQNAKR